MWVIISMILQKPGGKEFDFVIGSSHFVDQMDPYEREYWKHFGEKEGFRAFLKYPLTGTKPP